VTRRPPVAILVLLVTAACARPSTSPSPRGAAVRTATPTTRSPDPNFDSGQTVYITATGFAPKWLVSIQKLPVVWVNRTNHVQSVIFDHQAVRSGPIPPGASFSWTSPNMVSITYHNGELPSQTGAVQVSQPLVGG
jgi:hypothetical protein